MSVQPVESVGFTQMFPEAISAISDTEATGGAQAASGVTGAAGPQGPGGTSFAHALGASIDHLEAVTDNADRLAVAAATGKLDNIHDYTIAASEAAITTQLTTAVRNRALESFNEIMRMPVG